jgi:hypothetical protein
MKKRKSEHHLLEILEVSEAMIDKIEELEKDKTRAKWQRIGIRILGYGLLVSMLAADLLGFFRIACGYWY